MALAEGSQRPPRRQRHKAALVVTQHSKDGVRNWFYNDVERAHELMQEMLQGSCNSRLENALVSQQAGNFQSLRTGFEQAFGMELPRLVAQLRALLAGSNRTKHAYDEANTIGTHPSAAAGPPAQSEEPKEEDNHPPSAGGASDMSDGTGYTPSGSTVEALREEVALSVASAMDVFKTELVDRITHLEAYHAEFASRLEVDDASPTLQNAEIYDIGDDWIKRRLHEVEVSVCEQVNSLTKQQERQSKRLCEVEHRIPTNAEAVINELISHQSALGDATSSLKAKLQDHDVVLRRIEGCSTKVEGRIGELQSQASETEASLRLFQGTIQDKECRIWESLRALEVGNKTAEQFLQATSGKYLEQQAANFEVLQQQLDAISNAFHAKPSQAVSHSPQELSEEVASLRLNVASLEADTADIDEKGHALANDLGALEDFLAWQGFQLPESDGATKGKSKSHSKGKSK